MKKNIIIDDYLYIMLPEYFFDMPEELKRLKYVSEFRPPMIKTSLDTKVNITFSILNEELENSIEGASSFITVISKIKDATVKSFEKISDGILQNEHFNIGWFDYISRVLDGRLYNFEFIVPLKSGILYGTFNCPTKEYDFWKEILLKLIKTISILDEEQGYKDDK